MNLGPVTDTELLNFLSELDRHFKAHYLSERPDLYADEGPLSYEKYRKVGATFGKRYIKLSVAEVPRPGNTYPVTRVTFASGVQERVLCSTYCFIDRETGDILKPAGASSPAKGIRGNIHSGDWWSARGDKALGPYGVASLR